MANGTRSFCLFDYFNQFAWKLASLCTFLICQENLCKVLHFQSSNRRDWYLEYFLFQSILSTFRSTVSLKIDLGLPLATLADQVSFYEHFKQTASSFYLSDGDCGEGKIHTSAREISRGRDGRAGPKITVESLIFGPSFASRLLEILRARVCISPAPQSPSPELETSRSLTSKDQEFYPIKTRCRIFAQLSVGLTHLKFDCYWSCSVQRSRLKLLKSKKNETFPVYQLSLICLVKDSGEKQSEQMLFKIVKFQENTESSKR